MNTQIYINLPVKDLKKSRQFFNKLGFEFNEQFSDDKAACMIVNQESFVMLLTEPFFQTFTTKHIADANKHTEVLLAISAESKKGVDQLVDEALKMGAKEARDPQDHGFMYGRSFHDLEGHIWEVMWMNPEGMPSE